MRKVMVLEDESSIRSFIVINLRRAGYEVVEAETGEEALDKLHKNPDTLVALLDVMLPKMIGFDVCRTLREEGNNVPVIILTAREEEADKVSGLEIGADDYITKPFSMRELIGPGGSQHPPHGYEHRRRGHRCGHSHAGGRGPLHRHGQPSGLPGRQASGADHAGI